MLNNTHLDNKPYLSPTKSGVSKLSVKKSVFISYSFPVKTKEEAEKGLSEIKKKYPDAKHYVYAWSIKGESSHEKHSDDHEPAGSAGVPIASIISSNNISNVMVVVVRYFGGTLLGIGGLSKAYTKAAIASLNNSDLKYCKLFTLLSGITGYSNFEIMKRYCIRFRYNTFDEKYEDNISFRIFIPNSEIEIFQSKIADLTTGGVFLTVEGYDSLPDGNAVKI